MRAYAETKTPNPSGARYSVAPRCNALPESHTSVIVCQITSDVVNAPALRVTVDPSKENGLRVKSQVMADKPVTVRRERIGRQIGRLGANEMAHLDAALAFVLGLAD